MLEGEHLCSFTIALLVKQGHTYKVGEDSEFRSRPRPILQVSEGTLCLCHAPSPQQCLHSPHSFEELRIVALLHEMPRNVSKTV